MRTDEELIRVLKLSGTGAAKEAASRLTELLGLLEQFKEQQLAKSADSIIIARHIKRGSEYHVAPFTVSLQSSAGPVPEGTRLTIYVSSLGFDGFARATEEFNDGRFEKVQNDPPA